MSEVVNQPEARAETWTVVSIDLNGIRASHDGTGIEVPILVENSAGHQLQATHFMRDDGDNIGFSPLIRAYLADKTYTVLPYVPPTLEEARDAMPPLTARQFRLGLVNAGISPSQVTATIAAMPAGPDRDKAQIEWEYATTFNRMHPLIATVGAALGLLDAQIDNMWTAAVSL
ncbi:hypothetical protein ACU4I5_18565 [Ensifer adhaerens]